jgi:hypothetical protein
MKNALCWMSLFLSCTGGRAQTSFLVVQLSGSGYYNRSDQKIALKIGTTLMPYDVVDLKAGTRLTMVCNNYADFQLAAVRAPVAIALKKYTDSCPGAPSATTGFFRYLWQALTTGPAETGENDNDNMTVTGASTRSMESAAVSDFEPIPGRIRFYRRDFAIRWKVNDTAAKLELVFFSPADSVTPVLRVGVKDHFAPGAVQKQLPSGMAKVYWTLLVDGQEVFVRKTLEFLTDEGYRQLLALPGKDPVPTGADRQFLLGYFLELHGVYGEADQYYRRALEEGPKNSFYADSRRYLEHRFVFPSR